MVLDFLRELRTVWGRQDHTWRTVVTRQVFNRFFNQMTIQYSNIYIRELGASPVELGTANSASGIGSTIISLPLGYIQDQYSVTKIYLIGVALLTSIPFLYAIAHNWQLIIPAILIYGIGTRLGSCVVICDLSLPNEDRATGKALCEGIGALPTLFAPTLAAILVTSFGGINVKGIRPLYWLQFIAFVLLLIFVYVKADKINRPEPEFKTINPVADFREVFQRGTAVKRWLLFLSINLFTSSMMTPFQYPFAYEVKGAGPFIIGGFTTATILTEVIFSTPLGRAADKLGRKRLFYILMPLFSLANIVFILSPSQEWLLLSGFLFGFRMVSMFAYGSMTPELVPMDCIGRWRGLIGLFTGLATIPAPIIGGFIWENLGPSWVFIIPTIIDLFVRLPILYTVPETLHRIDKNKLDII